MGRKCNNVCLYSLPGPKFPVSGDKNVSFPPGTGRIPFTREIYLSLSRKKGQGGRRAE